MRDIGVRKVIGESCPPNGHYPAERGGSLQRNRKVPVERTREHRVAECSHLGGARWFGDASDNVGYFRGRSSGVVEPRGLDAVTLEPRTQQVKLPHRSR